LLTSPLGKINSRYEELQKQLFINNTTNIFGILCAGVFIKIWTRPKKSISCTVYLVLQIYITIAVYSIPYFAYVTMAIAGPCLLLIKLLNLTSLTRFFKTWRVRLKMIPGYWKCVTAFIWYATWHTFLFQTNSKTSPLLPPFHASCPP